MLFTLSDQPDQPDTLGKETSCFQSGSPGWTIQPMTVIDRQDTLSESALGHLLPS